MRLLPRREYQQLVATCPSPHLCPRRDVIRVAPYRWGTSCFLWGVAPAIENLMLFSGGIFSGAGCAENTFQRGEDYRVPLMFLSASGEIDLSLSLGIWEKRWVPLSVLSWEAGTPETTCAWKWLQTHGGVSSHSGHPF